MMKNKILSILLCAALAVAMLSTLTACDSDKKTDSVGGIASSETRGESEQATEHDTDISETEPVGDGSGDTTDDKPEDKVEVATVAESVMWEDDNVKITALELGGDTGYHILKLQIDNKTSEDIYVMASRTAVNGFVVEPVMGVDVAANSTTEGNFMIRKSIVPGVIADIETRFTYNSSNYAVSGKTKRVKIETSAAPTYDYSYDESGTVLYDGNGIKIVFQGFTDDGNLKIYMSSTGELSEGCMIDPYKIYVNGKECSSGFFAWVFTNTRNLSEMEMMDEDLDGNPLGEIKSVQLSFKISRENAADSNPVKTELVEIPLN